MENTDTKGDERAQQDADDKRVIDLAIRMLFLGLFVYSALLIIAPLIGVVVWAIILAAAIYPLHTWVTSKLGGRAGLSATLLTLIGLAMTIGPLAASVARLTEAVTRLGTRLAKGELKIPPPPADVSLIYVRDVLSRAARRLTCEPHPGT